MRICKLPWSRKVFVRMVLAPVVALGCLLFYVFCISSVVEKSVVFTVARGDSVSGVANRLMKKGLIVRHLVLPTLHDDSIKIFNWIKENLGEETIISLMSQYVP